MGLKRFIAGLPGRTLARSGRVSLSRAERWLRIVSTLFFFALLIPAGILIDTIYSQLDNEAMFQLRNESERVLEQANRKIAETISNEENRPFNDYSFFNVTELPLVQQKRLAISPLAQETPANSPPGLIGYFQVDPEGGFSSPIVPAADLSEADIRSLGISADEVTKRTAVRDQLYTMLFSGEPAIAAPPSVFAQKDAAIAEQRGETGAALDQNPVRQEEFQAAQTAQLAAAATAENDLPRQQILSKAELNSQLKEAAPDQFLNSQVGKYQGQKVADLNLESKWAPKSKSSSLQALKKVDEYLSQADSWQSARKKVVVDTAAPESSTRDLYANFGSVAQEEPAVAAKSAPVKGNDSQSVGNDGRSVGGSNEFIPELRYKRRPVNETNLLAGRSTEPSLPARQEQTGALTRGTAQGVKILSFEAEIEPLRSRALPDRRVVFYRNVWRENRRYIQGFVVDGPSFLRQILDSPISSSALDSFATVIVSYADQVFEKIRSRSPAGQSAAKPQILISNDKLSSPLGDFGLLITAPTLPQAPARRLVDFLSWSLLAVVLIGQWALYTIARKQIRLAKERSDFVSAVSHELKTPLTSIRMYAEMLREGWVGDESKKRSYYDFIFRESERLSRLIGNVLDFSKLSNNPGTSLELKRFTPPELYERAREKIAAMVSSAGFTLEQQIAYGEADAQAAPALFADEDGFVRIIINLVDNAIKFSAQSPDKRVAFGLRVRTGGRPEVIFSVRDFGPGVAREKMKKIFTLFYRGSDEMTRTTQGTGIGLALVKELAETMGARIDLSNQEPGAQFEVVFRAESAAS